ncbi:MAG: hypothetical protein ACREKM_09435 [Longimicrobiales bacterium]
MTKGIASLAAACLLAGSAGGVHAQNSLTARCTEQAPVADVDFCNTIAQAIEIAQPRIGIAASAGNPTMGTSSTLGMRIGSFPRIAIAPRVTVAALDLPPIAQRNGDEIGALVPAIGVDAGVGVFSGLAMFPTVGGFGSLDVYGSLGRVLLPGDEGFDGGITTWALGAQVGILRESFTAPGISVTGTYRSIGDISFGDELVTDSDAHFALDGLRAWGLRGTIGKRFLLFSATAGAGYDWYESDVLMRFATDDPSLEGSRTIETAEFGSRRFTGFGNLAFTVVIVSVVGELGWQQGAGPFTGPGASDLLEKGGWYGSLALRLTL